MIYKLCKKMPEPFVLFSEFEEERFRVSEPVPSPTTDEKGTPLTNYIYKYSYVYPLKDENGNLVEKTDVLRVQLADLKIQIGAGGFKTEKKISKKQKEEIAKG